jgi:hypothetical protein
VRHLDFWLDEHEHDGGEKKVLGRSGRLDGGDVVDLCVDQPACPRFLATKLLRFYVLPEPPTAVVDEMTAALLEERLALAPTLARLFASQLFFSKRVRGALIQAPVELCVAAVRAARAAVSWTALADATAEMGQALFAPPNVKGWDGQRAWINSRTLLARGRFAEALAFGGGGPNVRVDWKSVVGTPAGGAADAVALVERLATALLAVAPGDATAASLAAYAASPAAGTREARVRNVAHLVLSSPEAQLH